MKHLSCREWGHLEIGDGDGRVTRSEADALLRLADRAAPGLGLSRGDAEGEKILLDGRHRLRMQQVVGILVTGTVTLEILPKIDKDDAGCRQGLVAMLAEAGETRIASLTAAALDSQNRDLLEVMIAGFARDLLAALRPGISHGYLSLHEDLAAMRGRLDVKRQSTRLAGRADLLSCQYDVLSPDTALNRILKTAALMLSRLAGGTTSRRLLGEALMLLDGASLLPRGKLPGIHFTRMTERFRPVHDLACLFLRHSWQSTSSGARDGVAMLFRMNQLFEAWIGRLLHRSLSPQGWDVHLQASGKVRHALSRADQPLFAMYPDILLHREGRHVILDTKWKALDDPGTNAKRKVAQSDVYQMLAYREAWEADQIALIYPRFGEGCAIDRLQVQAGKVPFLLIEVPVSDPRRNGPEIRQMIGEEINRLLCD